MMDDEKNLPLAGLIGLGTTQIIGYGTLYYAFSVLVPDIARDLGRSEQWIFGAFSLSLLVGGLAAPLSGRLADRFGGARVMGMGSIAAAGSLGLTALSGGAWGFVLSLILMQVVSATVLYASAFTTIVQVGGRRAQISIVHLTLIAGFASTIFWPITSYAHTILDWRQIYLAFAAINLLICAPIHFALPKAEGRGRRAAAGEMGERGEAPPYPPHRRKMVGLLMMTGFAIEGFALSAMLVHVVPLMQALGLGDTGLFVVSLFGPAQVASRLVNLVFGRSLRQSTLAVLSAVFLPVGLVVLLLTTPSLPGAILFAICMGLGSGLTSIVSGTLPLELFGRDGYGRLMGWATLAKQIPAAIAPFALSVSLAGLGTHLSLFGLIVTGLAAAAAFQAIRVVVGRGAAA